MAMRISLFCSLILLGAARADSQNLLANGSFEDLNICAEYHVACSPSAWFVVMSRAARSPGAIEGKFSLSFCFESIRTLTGRTFPYTRILCPLQPDKEYTLSGWIHPGLHTFTHLDVLLTGEDPSKNNRTLDHLSPSFTIVRSDIVQEDQHGWIKVSKKIRTDSIREFILLGNLSHGEKFSSELIWNARRQGGDIFYWVDELKLEATDPSLNTCPLYKKNMEMLYADKARHSHRHDVFFIRGDEDLTAAPVPSGDTASAPVIDATPPIPLKTDTLVIPGVLFETNSSRINKAYSAMLDSVIARIGDKVLERLEINGYTDNAGTADFNKKLSLARAESVKAWLTLKIPQMEYAMQVQGFGMDKPVVPNTTPANKAKNRRVEIVLLY